MIWTKPLAWFLVGSSRLPFTASVTSECIPYRDVCYTVFPNADMDIPASRKKRQDIYALKNDSMRDDTYANFLLQQIEEGKLEREREEQFINMQNTRQWKTRRTTIGKKTPPPSTIKASTPAVENNDPAASTGELSKPHRRRRRSCRNVERNPTGNGKNDDTGILELHANEARPLSPSKFMLNLMNEAKNMESEQKANFMHSKWFDYAANLEEGMQNESVKKFASDLQNEIKNMEPEEKVEFLNFKWGFYVNGLESEKQNKLSQEYREEIKTPKKIQKLKQGLLVKITYEFGRFISQHGYDITLTEAETTKLSQITDEKKQERVRLTKVCVHVITDLSTDYQISDLNKEIDLVEHKNLQKLTKTQRVKAVCEALVALKFDRIAKIHDVLVNGDRIEKIKLFKDNEFWNEGLVAFYNGHQT